MSIVRWQDEGQPGRPISLATLLGIGFCLFCFFGGYRLIASLWVWGQSPAAWWPLLGAASAVAFFLAMLGPCILLPLMKRLKVPGRVVAGVLWGLGIACVLAVVWDSRSRVEMRGHEIWVRNVVGGAQVYRPAEIVSLQVSCLNGRRSSPEPSLRLEMKDGREIDLTDMFSLGPNGPETAAWLNAVEGVVQAARHAGIAKASRHPEQGWLHFDRGCVTGFSERFSADDRARVAALFAFPS